MINLIERLKKASVTFRENEPMKNHTSFKTGGDARLFISPGSSDELSLILNICREEGTEVFILGNGSNLLVSDGGITDKAVIHIDKGLDFITRIDDTTFEAGAGATLASICKYALANGLTGLEFAYGIPGSVGGAAFMNAGAYGGEMKDVVLECKHIDGHGNKGKYTADELDFSYRHSRYSLGDMVITSVVFRLQKGDKENIKAKMDELIRRRKDKQPLEYPSAGSVFKRPEGYFAGALIEKCGLKGKTIGGAQVSEKHAGFIINIGDATTKDITDLIAYCRDTVMEKIGVSLETEIRFV